MQQTNQQAAAAAEQISTHRSATRFRIAAATGGVFTGYVQGRGGLVGAANAEPFPLTDLGRMLATQRMATKGRPLPIYEIAPGCVKLLPEWSYVEDGPEVVVSLVGAVIEVAS